MERENAYYIDMGAGYGKKSEDAAYGPSGAGITEKEILSSCCGTDKEGFSRAVAVVRLSYIKVATGEEEKTFDEIILGEPVIEVYRSPVLTTVDLIFSPESFELANCFARMQDFICEQGKEKSIESEETLPILFLTISPRRYMDRFFCTGMHGAFYLMPSKVGYPPDSIRFIFNSALFGTYVTEEESEPE